MRKRKFIATFLAVVISIALVATPVMAAYLGLIQVITGATAYPDPFPALVDMDNTLMVAESIIDADGLDVQVERSGAALPRMLADDKTLFASALNANSTTNFYYTTDNTPEVFDVLTGYDGNITIYDAGDGVTLELGSDFEIEQSGYVDTDYVADKNLVYKDDAFRTYISAEDEITSAIMYGANEFPVVEAVNGGNDVVNQLNHTVNLPAGIMAGDLLIVLFASDANPVITFPNEGTDWIQLFEDGDGTGAVKFAAAYRIADGGEGASIVVTTGNAEMTAHTTYRISGYSEVPEVGVSAGATSANPDPPNLTPSWGSANTLWLAVEGNDHDAGDIVTAYPANYTDGRNDVAVHAEGAGVGSARRELRAVSENPGTFTLFAAEQWVTNTIAIAPVELEVTATSIDSDEYTVKTYGVANEPAWATGDVLHFTGAADSNVNAGAIHNASAKLWVSCWFRLDADHAVGDGVHYIWGKRADAVNKVAVSLENNGKLILYKFGGGSNFTLNAQNGGGDITSWTGGQWYHIIASISSVNGARLIVDNGTVATNADAFPIPNGGDFCIGDDRDPGSGSGFIGEIQNVIVGTDDLSVAEEATLYAGTAPGDETNYWYIDEGTGTGVDAVIDYGSAPSHGDVDAACTWETATYTTGKTGRLCDFYIEVDDGVADPDRWGANLKGASVPPNGNDWRLNQNNVIPWMDYYYHTVGGVLHAWYQPNYIVEATNYDGTETAGGSAVTVTDNTMTDAPGYWVDALVTITEAGGAAPEGEARVCTVFAAGGVITVAPAFSANVDVGDDFTIDFGTLIDRSYYGLEFDAVNDVIACGAATDMDITDTATLTAWVYIDSDGENNEGSIIDRRDATPDGYRLYVSSEAAGNVAIEALLDGATDAYAVSNVDVSISGWHYIVAVYNRLGTFHFEIYEDGVLLGLGTDQAGVAPITGHTANVMNIGDNAASNRCFDGRIDEPSFYTTAWTQALITANYNAGVGLYTPTDTTSIALQLHMEEGSGAAVVDTSGEANDGTITNAVWINGFVPKPAGNAGTNDSRITWGVNPADISYTIGSLVSTDVTIVTVTAPTPQDVLPVLPDIELFGMSAPVNMFSPWFDTLSNFMDIPSVVMWVTFAMLLIVGIAVLMFFVTKSVFASTMIAAFLMAGCSVSGFLPIWTLILAGIIAVFSLAQKKVI